MTILSRWVDRRWLILRVTAVSAAVIQAGLLFQSFSRGLDYVASATHGSAIISAVDQAIPIHLAGWLFVVFSVLGAVGVFLKRLPLAALSHMAIAVLYAIFASSALVDVMTAESTEGWRTGTAWAVAALLHTVLAHVSEDGWRVHRAG
ncbi:minor tail protein [Rhodococcus phage ReqiPine5]|uniref:Gp18 n=1 Tax=Rhodococcus phage ReqiPine5 TaxID=691963 RepID=D4P7Z3_9CAUD|nr:minor tail protein [Rhodococcus phage ReqiPine5]ADD81123.1 gp18 [Rhodococcus phage ReqiPine5]